MKIKPITPYQRLMMQYNRLFGALSNLWNQCFLPKEIQMWRYPAEKLTQGWTLFDLAERTRAADQLGYDVVLRWNNDPKEERGLLVIYRKRLEKPSEL